MKVCNNCGEEISTRDGENLCSICEEIDSKAEAWARRKLKHEQEGVLESLGLTKVKGALGGTYWE